jgi:hypothetical protein
LDIALSLSAPLMTAAAEAEPPLAASAFLVTAAAASPLPRRQPRPENMDERIASVFDLLARLQNAHDLGSVRT